MSGPKNSQRKILVARNSFEILKEKVSQQQKIDEKTAPKLRNFVSRKEDNENCAVSIRPPIYATANGAMTSRSTGSNSNDEDLLMLDYERSRASIASSVLSDDLRSLQEFPTSLNSTPRANSGSSNTGGEVTLIQGAAGTEMLTNHIAQLEDLVSGMRQSLVHILTELGSIQGSDREITNRMETLDNRYQHFAEDTTNSVRGFRSDLEGVIRRVDALTSNQTVMQNSLDVIAQQINTFPGVRYRNTTRNTCRRSRSIDLTTLAAAALRLDINQHERGGASTVTSSDPDSGVNTVVSTRSGRAARWGHSDQSSPMSGQLEKRDEGLTGGVLLSPEDGYISGASDCKVINDSLELYETLRCQFAGQRTSENSEHESEESNGEENGEFDGDETTEAGFKTALTIEVIEPGQPPQKEDWEREHDRLSEAVDVSCQVTDSLLKVYPTSDLAECKHIALELLRSEKHYCNSLWNLQENIYEPLKRSDLISMKDLKIMFPDELFRIYEQHCILLHKVEDRLIRWESGSSGLGDLYMKLSEPRGYLCCLYTDYVAAFPKITKLVEKYFVRSTKAQKYLKRNARVLTCRSARMKMVDSMQLGTFLIAPVQRIPQYILIFKRLTKHTPPHHEDRGTLEIVMENFKEFGEEINANIQKSILSDNTPPVKPRRKKRITLHKKDQQPTEEHWDMKSADSAETKSPSPHIEDALTPTLTSLGNSFYGKKLGGSGSLSRSRSGGHNSAAAIIRRTSSRVRLNPVVTTQPNDQPNGNISNQLELPQNLPPRAPEPDVTRTGTGVSIRTPVPPDEREQGFLTPATRNGKLNHDMWSSCGQATTSDLDIAGVLFPNLKDSEDFWGPTGLFSAVSEPAISLQQDEMDFNGVSHVMMEDNSNVRTSTPTTKTPGSKVGSTPASADRYRPSSAILGMSGNENFEFAGISPGSSVSSDYHARPLSMDPWKKTARSESVCRRRNFLTKNVSSFRNTVAAFFSKKKNARRFNAAGLSTSMSASEINYPSHVNSRPPVFSSTPSNAEAPTLKPRLASSRSMPQSIKRIDSSQINNNNRQERVGRSTTIKDRKTAPFALKPVSKRDIERNYRSTFIRGDTVEENVAINVWCCKGN